MKTDIPLYEQRIQGRKNRLQHSLCAECISHTWLLVSTVFQLWRCSLRFSLVSLCYSLQKTLFNTFCSVLYLSMFALSIFILISCMGLFINVSTATIIPIIIVIDIQPTGGLVDFSIDYPVGPTSWSCL